MFDIQSFLKGKGSLFVFDVEAIGLHGEGFAYGYCVITADGIKAQLRESCPPGNAQGAYADREWANHNVPEFVYNHPNPRQLRSSFWDQWRRHRANGSYMVAECPWPVEANFLRQCVQDDPIKRIKEGPYPLIDISSILWLAGINPLSTFSRTEEELPVHDPLKDAIQSARLLLEAMQKIRVT